MKPCELTTCFVLFFIMSMWCGGLSANGPLGLYIWIFAPPPLGRTVWEGLRDRALLEEVCHWGRLPLSLSLCLMCL